MLTITLRSTVRGLGGLVISIPSPWDDTLSVSSDETLTSSSRSATISSTSASTSATSTASSILTSVGEVGDRDSPLDLAQQIPSRAIRTKDISRCENDCSICLESFRLRQHIKELPCGHMFHKNCIDRWVARSEVCPCCRCNISAVMLLKAPEARRVTRFRLRSSR
jgi:hypothetical protein